MADVKGKFEDDDVDLKDIGDMDGNSDDSENESVPDETMDIPTDWPNSLDKVWLSKIPKSLMEKFSGVNQPGHQLASVRVWNNTRLDGSHRIEVILPPNPPYDPSGESKSFDFIIPPSHQQNQFVFADQAKQTEDGQPPLKRARTTKLVGSVAHAGHFQPSELNHDKIRQRHQYANRKDRVVQKIDDKLTGGGRIAGGIALHDPDALARGAANFKMLAAGANRGQSAIGIGKRPQPGKSTERFARIPQNELIDKLTMLFREKDAWLLKDLRAATEQPHDYLKETLNMIAHSPRQGPLNNHWLLKDAQKRLLDLEGPMPGSSRLVKGEVKGEPGVKGEEVVDEGEDDDEDDDMEDGGDEEDDFEEV